MNDFIYRLTHHINQLNLDDYPTKIGILDDNQCLTIRPVTGSEVLYQYMDNMTDVRLPFEVIVKAREQEEGYNTLADVMNHVRDMQLSESDEGFVLLKLEMEQMPVFDKFEEGYFYYTTKLVFDLTVYG